MQEFVLGEQFLPIPSDLVLLYISVVASATIELIDALSVVRTFEVVTIFTSQGVTIALVCFSSLLFALLARSIRVSIGVYRLVIVNHIL